MPQRALDCYDFSWPGLFLTGRGCALRHSRPTIGVVLFISLLLASTEGQELTIRDLKRVPASLPTVRQGERSVPVIQRADVVVVGGGVAGVAAALRAASHDRSVVLIDEHSYFGYEFTSCLRGVTEPYRPAKDCPVAEKICKSLMDEKVYCDRLVNPAGLKIALSRLVAREKRIKTYLYSRATGAVLDGKTVCGVEMVNKSGRQVVLGKIVVDATGDARIAKAAGALLSRPITGQKTLRRFLRMINITSVKPGEIAVPASLGVLDNKVIVHGAPEGCGRIVEFAVRREIGPGVGYSLSEAQATTRRTAMAVVLHLCKNVSGFAKASYRHLGDEFFMEECPVVSCRGTLSEANVAALDFGNLNAFVAKDVGGLVIAGRTLASAAGLAELEALLCAGEHAGRMATRLARDVASLPALGDPVMIREEKPSGDRVREFLKGPDTGRAYPMVREAAKELPVVDSVDVLVAGGGAAGAPAAIAAARCGVKVAVVELLPMLGGAGTAAGINRYYYGTRRPGLQKEIDERSGGKRAWPVEQKKLVLQHMILEAGGKVYYDTVVVGAVVEGNTVKGVVIENAGGRQVILAKVVIDTTGDADVAAAAGATFTKGRATDGLTAAVTVSKNLDNSDSGIRDATHVEDRTLITMRAVNMIGLKTKRGPLHFISPQLGVRETRHIAGDYFLTMRDTIEGRRFADVVYQYTSHYDNHGRDYENEADIAQNWVTILGNWQRRMKGDVPYRCLLPKGLENILVACRAFSADHNAQQAVRMQPDMQLMGEAAAVAAALAVKAGVTPRQLDVKALQDALIERQVLDKAIRKPDYTKAPVYDLAAAAKKLGTDKAQHGMTTLWLAGEKAVPVLRPLLGSDNADVRMDAAMTLGMLGDCESVRVLTECLRSRSPRFFGKPVPGKPYYYGAIVLLGRLKVNDAVPLLVEVLKDRGKCPPDLAVFTIKALEKIGDPAAVEAIKPYLAKPEKPGRETRPSHRWALRVSAAKALANLGDDSGIPVLIEYLDDSQAFVRNYAERMLREITHQPFGKDKEAWRAWWAKQKEKAPE